jgi:hypothetical protein
MWELDLIKEERKSLANNLDFDDIDDGIYDDFVIIER